MAVSPKYSNTLPQCDDTFCAYQRHGQCDDNPGTLTPISDFTLVILYVIDLTRFYAFDCGVATVQITG